MLLEEFWIRYLQTTRTSTSYSSTSNKAKAKGQGWLKLQSLASKHFGRLWEFRLHYKRILRLPTHRLHHKIYFSTQASHVRNLHPKHRKVSLRCLGCCAELFAFFNSTCTSTGDGLLLQTAHMFHPDI